MLGRYFQPNRCNASRLRAFNARPYSSLKSRHNQEIVDLLLKYKAEEEQRPDANSFKVYSFARAIHAVMNHNRPIQSGTDVLALPGIGLKITNRINEHLFNLYAKDTTAEAKGAGQSRFSGSKPVLILAADPSVYQELVKSRALVVLGGVPGIGRTTAKKLVDAGCHSIEDLKSAKFSAMLTTKQAINVKYMGHFEHAIGREDAENVVAFCQVSLDPKIEVTLVGDYRRGMETSQEIHVMISHPDFVHVPLPIDAPPHIPAKSEAATKKKSSRRRKDEDVRTNLLHTDIIPLLQQRGLISETLSSDFTSWQGVIRLPGPEPGWGSRIHRISAMENRDGEYRKMSIHLVPQKSVGSALLCLTGDNEFRKDICTRAQKLGMLFNQHGLWSWNSSQGDSPPSDMESQSSAQSTNDGYWSLAKSAREEEIFQELGMDFIEPSRRNFGFVSGKRRGKRTTDLYL